MTSHHVIPGKSTDDIDDKLNFSPSPLNTEQKLHQYLTDAMIFKFYSSRPWPTLLRFRNCLNLRAIPARLTKDDDGLWISFH